MIVSILNIMSNLWRCNAVRNLIQNYVIRFNVVWQDFKRVHWQEKDTTVRRREIKYLHPQSGQVVTN